MKYFSLCGTLSYPRASTSTYQGFALYKPTMGRTRSSAYYECRKGFCSRSQCRLTRHCTVMPLSTYGSLHQSPTSRPDKDLGLPPRTIFAFLLSDWLYCWTSCFLCRWRSCLERSSCRCHFNTFFVHFPKTFKTASLSTLLSWACSLN